jgi:transposase InsO family protein
LLQGRQASFDRPPLDDGGAGDGVLRKGFKNIVHMLNFMEHETSKERIVAGDLVAFHKFWSLLNEAFDKADVIHRRGPWKSFEAVEYATLEWVDWFNNRRLLEPIGDIPPAEAEQRYHDTVSAQQMAA